MEFNFLDLNSLSHLWAKIVAKINSVVAEKATKVVSSSTNGNIKVNDVETTVYTHPSTHDASVIVEDSTHKFVTDAEKIAWNAKTDSTTVQTMIDDSFSTFVSVEYVKLEESQYDSNGKPTITGESGKKYLVPNGDGTPNKYNEWIYIPSDRDFELVGAKTLDLSGYIKQSDLVPITNEQIDSITG